FPVAFLPENHALAIAIISYKGGIDFGLLGDYDAMEDIDTLASGISESIADLLAAAEAVQATQQGIATGADIPG
ncbi:MAG TPA: WS/DGAT domain-containing protein, partial [Solirubrobacterales bacterium]|nr:WS/DGAT domain-containing protein [Solirubrobacterales bacterium]